MPGEKEGYNSGLADRFLKGVGIATWQNAADDGLSNWSRFAYQRWPFSKLGISTTRGKYKVGKSCNFWDRYKEDLKLTKDLGSTSFRFSFEWARIEPTRGHYDTDAIQRFHDILDTMEELGLEPNVTLHHFTHPTWFEDLGGFRKEENIPIFVEWAQFMFRTFHKRIRLWATFNEPTCYSFLAFIVGMAPPGHIFNLIGSGQTMLNILKAHTATYKALKAMPRGQEAQIGLVNHHITFTVAGEGRLYKVASWMAEWLTYWWGWDIVDHWMHTGEFEWKLPVVGTWITWKDPEGKPPCDWWGINFYSRCVLSWCLQPACFPNDVMTDMYYPIYPEGLYNCIKRSSRYGIPMYITETGIADCRDDRRALFIDSYFKAVLRAIANGMDVRGFYYWSLMDNFEWATGFTMKFGLYAWEPDGSVDRVLKEGAHTLVRFYKTLPDAFDKLRSTARAAQSQLGGDMGVQEEMEKEGYVYVDEEQRLLEQDGAKKHSS